MKKGQAAMEFLMTYGWAIIVVLITIGALAYFGVLSPERIFGSSCILEPGLNCEDFRVAYTGGVEPEVTLIIGNSLGVDIDVVDVSLSDLPEDVTSCDPGVGPPDIRDGASGTYLFDCDGVTLDALFKATINFKYIKSGFTLQRTAIGSISTGVEGTGSGGCECSGTSCELPGNTGRQCDGCNWIDISGVSESCDSIDNNCDGQTDEGCPIELTSCGSISNSGNYKVMNSLSGIVGTCITITSDNVELDCQNYQISGTNTGYGVYIDGNDGAELTGITIRNCDITGFDRGMNMEYTDNSFVYDSLFTNNANSGIYLSYSDYNTLSNIEARGHSGTNDNGIGLLYSTNNNLNSGTVDGNYYGIGMAGSATFNTASNTITGFYITNNLNRGVWIWNADVDNNRFYNNKFSNTNPPYVASGANNYWNTALTSGTNIVNGPWIGGNFWTNPSGTGYSDTCIDSDNNGICDVAYQVSGAGNVDSYPLTTYP